MTAPDTADALRHLNDAAVAYALEHNVDPDDSAAMDVLTKAVMAQISKVEIDLVAKRQLEIEIQRVFDEDVASGRLCYDPVNDKYTLPVA